MENKGHSNIIPPKHGEIRNPNGRPKGLRNRKTIYRELLEMAASAKFNKIQSYDILGEDGGDVSQSTIGDQIAAAVVIAALKGDINAAREAMDSAHGKIADKLDNRHSFNQMPTVEAGVGDKKAPLSFDIGENPANEADEEV